MTRAGLVAPAAQAQPAQLATGACAEGGLFGAVEPPYMRDTYPPYLDQGLIQTVSTVSGPGYSGHTMYCISLYLDQGLIHT